MANLIFYFDMDGVLADFKRGVKEICGITPPVQDAAMSKEDEDVVSRHREHIETLLMMADHQWGIH